MRVYVANFIKHSKNALYALLSVCMNGCVSLCVCLGRNCRDTTA